MRVSTIGAYLRGLEDLQRLQSSLDTTQRQIASGRRILRPSDDPIATARSIELRESLSRLEQFDRNAGIARNRLATEETALNSINNTLQRARELALQANNATQSNESRKLIAAEMRQLRDSLVQLANERDGNGRFLFSGNSVDVQPVSQTGSTYTYDGDQGQRLIQIGNGRSVADGDNGAELFFFVREGNGTFSVSPAATNAGTGVAGPGSVVDPTQYDRDTYTVRFPAADTYEVVDSGATVIASGAFAPGDSLGFRGLSMEIDGQPAAGDSFTVAPSAFQDVFTTVERLATAIDQSLVDDTDRTVLTNAVNAGLQGIDNAIGNVLDARTRVGSRLAVIDEQVDANGAFALTFSTTLAGIEDLDYAEALSRLSIEASTLEAAQQSFVRTQSLSMFNFL